MALQPAATLFTQSNKGCVGFVASFSALPLDWSIELHLILYRPKQYEIK